jgi:hypothetical protein
MSRRTMEPGFTLSCLSLKVAADLVNPASFGCDGRAVGRALACEQQYAGANGKRSARVAAAHYPAIVALNAEWLAGLWILARDAPLHMGWVAAFAALQVLRLLSLSTLGRR